jgi:hypothetical protein
MNMQIVDAIENQQIIEFYYDGESRTVEPHCYGLTTAGNEGLRAFQTGGYSSSGKLGWKMYDMGKAESIIIIGNYFKGPRPGYQTGDKGMSKIYAEL